MSHRLRSRSSLQVMRAVIFALVLREMQTRFGARRMGAFWMLFEPVAHVVIIMMVFTFIRQRQVPGIEFPIFMVTGIVPFFLMRNIALRMMDAMDANKSLFAYQQIKAFDTFAARTIVEFALYACVMALILAAMGIWFGYDITINDPLSWMASLAVGVTFSFGLGLILAVIGDIAPNSKSIVKLVFFPLYLISGVIFPIWVIPPQYLDWILWNPYLHIIDNLRSSFFAFYPKTYGISHAYPFGLSIISLSLGMAMYRLRRRELVAQ